MIARLEERFTTYPPTAVLAAVVALTAAILALLPGVAEAQEQQQQQQGAAAPATAPAARSAVVAPGDSLWSICQERLGPSASAQQVALDVRRIHEINRNLIGDDPDLIFPGQRLALPPPAGVPAAPAGPEASADRASAPTATAARTPAGASGPSSAPVQRLKQAAQAHSQAIQEELKELKETAGGAPEQAARPIPERAPERAPEPIAPPALPEGGAVPGGGPDTLEVVMVVLAILPAVVVVVLVAVGRRPRRRLGVPDVAPHGQPPRQPAALFVEDADPPVGDERHPGHVPITGPAKRHEPGRNGAAAGSPRKGLAVAHSPSVRRALRRAPRGAPIPPGRYSRNRPVAARRAPRGAVVRRHPARRRAAGLARGRNR